MRIKMQRGSGNCLVAGQMQRLGHALYFCIAYELVLVSGEDHPYTEFSH